MLFRSIQRILGTSDIPDEVIEECRVVENMYHRSGGSGPAGAAILIDMLRRLGYAPPPPAEKREVVDWRRFRDDGSVRVELLLNDEWKPGVYKGGIYMGTIGVLLDGDDHVREALPYAVRLERERPLATDVGEVLSEEEIKELTLDDWKQTEAGTPVIAEGSEGEFVRMGNFGRLVIKVGDDEKEYPRDKVEKPELVSG